jgi:hypothetical protein
MRGMLIAGVILIGLGVAALMGMLNFTERKEVLKIGDLKATVADEKTVPQWLGIVAIVAGLGLAIGGARKR